MSSSSFRRFPVNLLLLAAIFAVTVESLSAEESNRIEFGRDILPILSDRCFQCHGPDEAQRESNLRLDLKEEAFSEADSGEVAIQPGDASKSPLISRITHEDPDLLMPPPESGLTLSEEEIQKLRKWIDQGAKWEQHWAFVPPETPKVPRPVSDWATRNPIDHFIHEGVQSAGLTPQPEADKETLLRRVTLDLTGLPPTIEEMDDFLADDTPEAYEKVVDRLLKSDRYGEHMARVWLDAARYADTHGLHLDNERQIWPYRDWVIKSFNRNMPFDEFTIEQLAGDLLPAPNLGQKVATGFNRCNVTTSEGGSIDEEYYVRYAVDRVETTSTVWLGLTAGCAACHDHKFDPLTQKEFYQLFSYFFSLTEKAMDGNALLPPPAIKVPTDEQRVQQQNLNEELTRLRAEIRKRLDEYVYQDPRSDVELPTLQRSDRIWFDDELPAGAVPQGNGENPWKFVSGEEHPVFSGETASVRTGEGLTQHFFTGATEPLMIGDNDSLFAYVYLDPDNPPETVQLQFNDGSWEHRAYWGADKGHGAGRNNASNLKMGELPATGEWVRLEVPAASVGLNSGAKLNGWAFTQFGGTVHWDSPGIVTIAPLSAEQLASQNIWELYLKEVKQGGLPGEVQKALDVASGDRNEGQLKAIRDHYLKQVNPESTQYFAESLKQEQDRTNELNTLNGAIPSSLIMEERAEPRQAHILERGEYTLKRDPVSSATPEWLGPQPEESPNNRLGLAKWLVNPEHPLTARVTVNRYWQHYFGTGLVKTSEDFGIQGERPSHPELLDWLALDFIDSGWDVRRMQKQIVMSATYRQASRVTPEQLSIDPENRLLSRGPRFRLDAEIIRDQALYVSGLMHGVLGGPSVKPYQPAGLWKPVGFGGSNTSVFKQDSGEKLYRRSMYTFWKRTSPPPSMTTFDAPDRETCQVRRARTNTPLQALVLMNDVQFIEAARKFAERILRNGGESDEQRLVYAFRSIVGRRPSTGELEKLLVFQADYRQQFGQDETAVTQFLSAGESPRDESLDASDLAAWSMLAHLLMNLSETITKG